MGNSTNQIDSWKKTHQMQGTNAQTRRPVTVHQQVFFFFFDSHYQQITHAQPYVQSVTTGHGGLWPH